MTSSRASTNALRQAFQLVAMIISIALTPMVTKALGYSLTAILYGLLGGAVILYMTFTSRETAIRVDEEETPTLGQPPEFDHQPEVLGGWFLPMHFIAPPCHLSWLPCRSL